MKKTFVAVLILALQGCATFKETVEVAQLKEGETVVLGKLTLERNYYSSGQLVRHEVVPFKSVSLAFKPFNSVQDVLSQYVGYAGVTRLLVNESANILVPVDPANYFLVDIHASSLKFLGQITHQEFSRQRGVLGTLELSVRKGIGNYIGHIHIIEIQERYKDSNDDGYIDSSEFVSSITMFNDVSGGKEKFPKTTYWRAYSFLVTDESNEVAYPYRFEKNLARFVKF